MLLALESLYLPSGPAPAPPQVVATPLPNDSDGATPKRRPPAPFISAHQLAEIQPVKVIKVPDWLLEAYLRGDVDEEEFTVLLALN